ncbi:MAG TPA: Fe-S oxidoreductase, partial [Bacteroidetes bacterium]|nr:Fe-S oxidoreductase [Bacteroidota bacterium]
PDTGNLLLGQYLSNLFSSIGSNTLILMERAAWCTHIAGIFFFLLYIPHSKHLHIFLAFPNSFYMRQDTPKGHMDNMPVIMNEVKTMLDPSAEVTEIANPPKAFGAKDVT